MHDTKQIKNNCFSKSWKRNIENKKICESFKNENSKKLCKGSIKPYFSRKFFILPWYFAPLSFSKRIEFLPQTLIF